MTKAFRMHPFEDGSFLAVKDGRLHMDGVDLVFLAEERGTPLFAYSAKRLRKNARTLQAAFRRHHPGSLVCFASKACANLSILTLLEREGVDLEVNSGGELSKAKKAGFSAARLVFNGVAKTSEEIGLALSPPIKAINVDSPFELQRIAKVAAHLGVRARISLRGIPGVEGGSTAGIETGSARSKFGMTEEEITQCIDLAAANPATLAVVGLHVHIGSQMTDLGLYGTAARYIARIGRIIKARFTSDFAHINIGGGFPVNYVKYNDQSPAIGYFHSQVSAEAIAAAVVPVLRESLGEAIELLCEPGRAMTSDAAVCLTRVENTKRRSDVTWLYLDTGYNVLPESGLGWYFHMVRANGLNEKELANFRVAGPLCDSIDVFFDTEGEAKLASLLAAEPALAKYEELLRRKLVRVPPFRELPASTGPGDIIALLDTGAYQIEMASHYCGRLLPAAVMIEEDGAVETIRHRETSESLSSCE